MYSSTSTSTSTRAQARGGQAVSARAVIRILNDMRNLLDVFFNLYVGLHRPGWHYGIGVTNEFGLMRYISRGVADLLQFREYQVYPNYQYKPLPSTRHDILRCSRRILVGSGFLWSVPCIKPIPTHEKLCCCGKERPKCHFLLFFLGLGWPWVGEFVGFIIAFICFPALPESGKSQTPYSCRRYSCTRYR